MSTNAHEQDAWERYDSWWHICFGTLTVLTLVLLAFDSAPTDRLLVAAGLVVALAAWYAVLCRHQINRADTRLGDVFLS